VFAQIEIQKIWPGTPERLFFRRLLLLQHLFLHLSSPPPPPPPPPIMFAWGNDETGGKGEEKERRRKRIHWKIVGCVVEGYTSFFFFPLFIIIFSSPLLSFASCYFSFLSLTDSGVCTLWKNWAMGFCFFVGDMSRGEWGMGLGLGSGVGLGKVSLSLFACFPCEAFERSRCWRKFWIFQLTSQKVEPSLIESLPPRYSTGEYSSTRTRCPPLKGVKKFRADFTATINAFFLGWKPLLAPERRGVWFKLRNSAFGLVY